MSARTPAPTARARKTRGVGGLVVVAALAIAFGATLWFVLEPKAEREDPNVVVNLTTMVGRPAPAFSLANSEGVAYDVAPGDGRKYLLIFHMGSV